MTKGTNETTATTRPEPTGWALRCCILAAHVDHWLESREVGASVSYEPDSLRPWWWLCAMGDACGWELQVGRWVFVADRPKRGLLRARRSA